jgi:hypothetical protein
MKMTYGFPEIPKNCPYFEVNEGHTFFVWPETHPQSISYTRMGGIENVKACHRRIIAAVARCAWLDEAERFREKSNEIVAESIPCFPSGGEYGETLQSIQGCINNANAWKAWGEAK